MIGSSPMAKNNLVPRMRHVLLVQGSNAPVTVDAPNSQGYYYMTHWAIIVVSLAPLP